MAKAKLVSSGGSGLEKLAIRVKGLEKYAVAVGIHEDAGVHKDSGAHVAKIAAVHEFGGDIKHPGGTRYTKIFGANRFVRNYSSSAMEASGTTSAHIIKIPERSFMRSTFSENEKSYKASIFRILKKLIKGEGDAKTMMGRFGQKVQNQIQAKIVSIQDPPNAKSTIRKKGSSNPLVDSGQMLQSIRWEYLNKDDINSD